MVVEVGVNSEKESGDSSRVRGGGPVGKWWPGIGSLLSALDMPCHCLLVTSLQRENFLLLCEIK